MEKEPSSRRGRVDAISKASKLDAVLIQLGDELDELTHRASEAIKLPYDQCVA